MGLQAMRRERTGHDRQAAIDRRYPKPGPVHTVIIDRPSQAGIGVATPDFFPHKAKPLMGEDVR
jgi:hypothetical protein